MKFEAARIHFLGEVFATVAFVVAKAPHKGALATTTTTVTATKRQKGNRFDKQNNKICT